MRPEKDKIEAGHGVRYVPKDPIRTVSQGIGKDARFSGGEFTQRQSGPLQRATEMAQIKLSERVTLEAQQPTAVAASKKCNLNYVQQILF